MMKQAKKRRNSWVFYVRICKRCDKMFNTICKTASVCIKCNGNNKNINDMKKIYTEEEINEFLSTINVKITDDKFIRKRNVRIKEDLIRE